MRCSLKLLVPVIFLAAPAVALAQSRFNVGTPLSQQEIKGFDFMIGPDGKELPPGHGSPKEGSAVFAKRCQVCHGQNGEGGAIRRLAHVSLLPL
jgi:S-disulfanyl-L-cysteine oxidoreductase SoxD